MFSFPPKKKKIYNLYFLVFWAYSSKPYKIACTQQDSPSLITQED